MNLAELLVASTLLLGTASGSLGIWARTAQAAHDAELLLRRQRQADERLLAVQGRLESLAAEQRASNAPVPIGCPGLAVLQPLAAPAAEPGAELALAFDASGEILSASVATAEGLRRERQFDLVVYGLCMGAS